MHAIYGHSTLEDNAHQGAVESGYRSEDEDFPLKPNPKYLLVKLRPHARSSTDHSALVT